MKFRKVNSSTRTFLDGVYYVIRHFYGGQLKTTLYKRVTVGSPGNEKFAHPQAAAFLCRLVSWLDRVCCSHKRGGERRRQCDLKTSC